MAFWNIFYYYQHFIIIMNFAIKSKIRQTIRFLKQDSLAFNFLCFVMNIFKNELDAISFLKRRLINLPAPPDPVC